MYNLVVAVHIDHNFLSCGWIPSAFPFHKQWAIVYLTSIIDSYSFKSRNIKKYRDYQFIIKEVPSSINLILNLSLWARHLQVVLLVITVKAVSETALIGTSAIETNFSNTVTALSKGVNVTFKFCGHCSPHD
jgi:hypothetical protein